MKKLLELLKKYRGVIAYLVFGVLTTLINTAVYSLLYEVCHVSNLVATLLAWLVAVLFAFITNKLFVFGKKDFTRKVLLYEIGTFFACRIATGVLDVAIMYVAVDVFAMNGTIWKLLSNVIVIILNYIASKLLIFRKKKTNEGTNKKEEK